MFIMGTRWTLRSSPLGGYLSCLPNLHKALQPLIRHSRNIGKTQEKLASCGAPIMSLRRLTLIHKPLCLPPGWTTYTIWQKTDGHTGPVFEQLAGLPKTDVNVFNGTPNEMLAFLKRN